MTQATVVKPAIEVKTCSCCPHFNNFHEPNGRGWCELFNGYVREKHEETEGCINSSDLLVSHELEDNLALFPDIDFKKLKAFPTEEIESELDKPHSEYEIGSVVKVIDAESDHTKWAVFEVVECLHNKYIHNPNNPEAYLNHVDWSYRLVSIDDSYASDKSLWVAQNEICHFDLSHIICTEEIF